MVRDSFPSAGGGRIVCRIWAPEGAAVGAVQLVHGIAEHSGRYAEFAEFLASHGYAVASEDHMGHGETVSDDCPLGCVRGGWDAMAEDVHRLTALLKARCPGLPLFLLGHSMGSFLARTYLYTYPQEALAGVVLSGTAWQPGPVLAAGRLMTKLEIRKQGADAPSPRLQKLVFGAYGRQFPGESSPDAWICSDPKVVEKYGGDPLCGFAPSAGLIDAMLEGLGRNQRRENLDKMAGELPVLFIAGSRDPVGAGGRGVKHSFAAFQLSGLRDVSLKLYEGDRHEVLNEKDKATVRADVLAWLEEKRAL